MPDVHVALSVCEWSWFHWTSFADANAELDRLAELHFERALPFETDHELDRFVVDLLVDVLTEASVGERLRPASPSDVFVGLGMTDPLPVARPMLLDAALRLNGEPWRSRARTLWGD